LRPIKRRAAPAPDGDAVDLAQGRRAQGRGDWQRRRPTREGATAFVRNRMNSMYQRILVPVDNSPPSRRALEEAIAMARLTGATVRVLHVLDELVFPVGFATNASYAADVLPRLRSDSARLLEEAGSQVAAAGVPVETSLDEGFARRTSDVILDAARDWAADLIVIGTHGRRGPSRLFMGSDAEQVVRAAAVPVLLVRSSES
jgi:nucleotide-binding universal stress UspA family protein